MGFDTTAAGAVGLAVGVWIIVWLTVRLIWRKSVSPPGVSLQLFAISLGLWVGGSFFYADREWLNHLGAALIVCGTIFGWVLFDKLMCVAWYEKRKSVPLPIILRQLGGLIALLIAVACVLKWGYGLKLTGLVATSGVAAVILGFAMQDLLGNVIAGFSIHVTGAYKVGDWLLMGEDGHRAEVTEINWRSTRLVDNDHISYEVPNSEVVKKRIVNLNHPAAEHGVRLRLGLDYDTPPALAKEVLFIAAKNAQGVLENPAPVVFTYQFGDSAVVYELRFWMREARLYNVACDEIHTALWYEMGRRGMKVPFPTRSLERRSGNVPESFVSARSRAAEILRGSGVLSCLAEDEAKGLVEKGTLKLFGPGEALVTRNEPGASMFVILDGSVQIIGKTAEGPQVVMAHLHAGDCFGEMSLVTGEPRNATVRAVGDVLVLEIRKGDISPLIEARPELAERLGGLLEHRQKHRSDSLNRAEAEASSKIGAPVESRSLVQRIRLFFSQNG